MNKSLAATVGELQAQIYWLHDALKFAELASAAATIYMKLGSTQQQAETAGNLISQAYQLPKVNTSASLRVNTERSRRVKIQKIIILNFEF